MTKINDLQIWDKWHHINLPLTLLYKPIRSQWRYTWERANGEIRLRRVIS